MGTITLVTMSLITDFNYIFTNSYPSLSVKELQRQLELLEHDRSYIQMRLEHHRCECNLESCPTATLEHKDGRFKARFHPPSEETICEKCQKTLAEFPSHWIGAGYSYLDHYHPRLLLEEVYYKQGLLEKAIFCKEKNYQELSNDELITLIQDKYAYLRYLRCRENDFYCRSEEVPQGLLDAKDTTKEEIGALAFEEKSRILRNILSDDMITS